MRKLLGLSCALLAPFLTVSIAATDYTAAGAPGAIESGSIFDAFFADASRCYGTPEEANCYRSRGLRPPTNWKILLFDEFEGPTFNFHYDAASVNMQDQDPKWGLENATLVTFYGHGDPSGWYARGTLDPSHTAARKVSIGQSSLGDFRTRYFWLFSCNVFAHGAAKAPNSYNCPGCFQNLCNPSSSSGANCQDVFSRWGALQSNKIPANPNLRMACGGSTIIGASPGNFAPIWHRLYVEKTRVASAFLLGLFHHSKVDLQVPLCLSLGKDETDLPLVTDATFIEAANPAASDADRLFISYPENRISVDVEDSIFAWKPKPIELPSLELPLFSNLFLLPFDPEAAVDRFGSKRILTPQLAGLESLTLLRTDPSAQFYQNLKSGALIATGESNDVARELADDTEIEDRLLSIVGGLRAQLTPGDLDANSVVTTTIVRRDVILRLDSESLEAINTSPQAAFDSLRRDNLCRFAEATFSLNGIPLNSLGARATIWACPRSENEEPSNTPHWRGAGNWGLSVRLPFLSQQHEPAHFREPAAILAAARARLEELEPKLANTFTDIHWRPQIELGTFNCRQEQAFLQIVVKFSSPSKAELPTYTFEIPAQFSSNGGSFEDLRSCSPNEEGDGE